MKYGIFNLKAIAVCLMLQTTLGATTPEDKICINNCRKSVEQANLKTVDEDYNLYKKCIASKCSMGAQLSGKPDTNTCVFLCNADTIEQNKLGKFDNKEDLDEYESDCYRDKCGVVVNGHTETKRWQREITLPTYIGCYDLPDALANSKTSSNSFQTIKNEVVAENMGVKECFDKVKKYGFPYAALQNGNQCWGLVDYGPGGRVSDAKCNYVCSKEKGYTCGGKDRNSVWNLSGYNGDKSNKPLCRTRVYAPPDCSLRGGYNPKDLCMQTCRSETQISEFDTCGLECIDYHFTNKADMAKKHDGCVQACMADRDNQPSPVGCFRDYFKRDLNHSLGENLSTEECIAAGKKGGYTYVGLQNGNECFADKKLGGYGMVADNQCHMPCVHDHSKFCGGGFRNLIYDLRDLHRRNQNHTDKTEKDCSKYPSISDCTTFGGYDPRDNCKQTCMSDVEIKDTDVCGKRCAIKMLGMTFWTPQNKVDFRAQCNANCTGISEMAPYLGCYKDKDKPSRDLKIFLGDNMPIAQCFNEAKSKGLKYAGLQYGNQCWAANIYGAYGKVDDQECGMICQNDPDRKCGDGWRNSVYDVSGWKFQRDCRGNGKPKNCDRLGGYDPRDQCKQTCLQPDPKATCITQCVSTRGQGPRKAFQECIQSCEHTVGIDCDTQYGFTDCSEHGGYDAKDQCHHTCVINGDATDKQSCSLICKQEMMNMHFQSRNSQYEYYQNCAGTCIKQLSSDLLQCSKKYINCEGFGGYDPRDPCKQTCNKKESHAEFRGCQRNCQMRISGMTFGDEKAEYQYWNDCQNKCNQMQQSCDNKCKSKMSDLRFITNIQQMQYYYSCKIKCKIDSTHQQEKVCTGDYVDCRAYGGYDPTDMCKQTCMQARPDEKRNKKEQKHEMDTVMDFITIDTKFVVKNGQRIPCKCEYDDFHNIKCKDLNGKALTFAEHRTMEDTYMTSRAPNGQYWKFDCNILQRFTLQNCFEGDDIHGKHCNIYEKLFTDTKCYNYAQAKAIAFVSTLALAYASFI